MPYAITLTNGNVFANVADGTINAQSPMVMIGKDFSGYGQYIDQNIIRLLESGASPTKPLNAQILQGQLWYDTTNQQLKVANIAGNTTTQFYGVGPSLKNNGYAPNVNVQFGDLWLYQPNANSQYNTLMMKVGTSNAIGNSSGWLPVGPYNNTSDVRMGSLILGQPTTNHNDANARPQSLQVLDQGYMWELRADDANINTLYIQSFASGSSNSQLTLGNITAINNLNGNGVYANSVTTSLVNLEFNPNIPGNVVSQVFQARYNTGAGPDARWNPNGTVPGAGASNNAGFYGNVYGTQYIYGGNIGNVTGRIASANATQLYGVLSSFGGQTQPNVTSITSNVAGKQLANAIYVSSTIADTAGGYNNVGYYGPQSNVIAQNFIGTLIGSVAGAGGGAVPSINANLVTADNLFVPFNTTYSNAAAWVAGNISRSGTNFPGSVANGDAKFNVVSVNDLLVNDGNLVVQQTGGGNAGTIATFYGNIQVYGNVNATGNLNTTGAGSTTTNQKNIILANNATSVGDFTQTGNIFTAAGLIIGGPLVPSSNIVSFIWNATTSSMKLDKPLYIISNIGNNTSGQALTVSGAIGATSVAANVLSNSSTSTSYFNNIYVAGTGKIYNETANGMANSTTTVSYVPSQYAINLLTTTVGNTSTFYAEASQDSEFNSVVVRTGNGQMRGTATSALYADLAERYLLDAEYPAGTLVEVGGTAEATAATLAGTPFGVVSTQPGFLMNEGLEGGTYIALKGRVPVRVTGTINKGDKLGPSDKPGIATVNKENYIAIALNTVEAGDEGVVEAIVL
jgi:hypothetical protein